MAGKRTLLAINLNTPAGFIATPFAASVDVTGAAKGEMRNRVDLHLTEAGCHIVIPTSVGLVELEAVPGGWRGTHLPVRFALGQSRA